LKTPELESSIGGAEARQIFSDMLTERLKAKGLSNAAVVQLTKITPVFVDSLILGKFDDLPGEVFGRGFVKNICKILGPGNEDLVTLFQRGWTRESKVELQANVLQASMTRRMGGAKPRSFRPTLMKRPPAIIILAISAALLASLTIAYLAGPDRTPGVIDSQAENVTNDADSSDQAIVAAPVVAQPAAMVSAPAEEGVAPAVTAVVAAPAVSTKPAEVVNRTDQPAIAVQKTPAEPVTVAGSGNLEIEVLAPVKVRKKIDAENAAILELTPQMYNFTVEDRAELLIYDAAAVRIKFGGRDLGVLGTKGRVRKLVFVSEKQDKKLQ
jgi:cytoskeletal protein RodZ